MRAILGALFLAGVLVPFGGAAHRLTERGNEHYDKQEHEEALHAYTEAQVYAPEAPELYYDIGNVLYRQEDYIGAEEAFTRALGGASRELSAKAAYNLGNALFRQQRYQEAAREYRRSLEIDPADQDAKRNLELALRELDKQQRQQQPQQDPQQQDSEQQEQEQQQRQQQQEQQQDQDRQDESQQQPQSGPQPEQRPVDMTPEEAQRLLDTLAAQERESLRQQALRRARSQQRGTEEDW